MGIFSNLFSKQQEHAAASRPEVTCPVAGTVVKLESVSDPAFASKTMGDGIAIEPSEGVLVAPVTGTVQALFPTGHAVAVQGDNGISVLLHIGIDTVDMKGDGFTAHISQGDRVSAGQKLVTFDLNKIAEAGHPATTMVLVAESTCEGALHTCDEGAVALGDAVIWFA